MKYYAIALASLSMLATPALADTVQNDGSGAANPAFSVTVLRDTKQDYAALITPASVSNSGKKTNFSSRRIFIPRKLLGGR
ncbi:MAG: hypothetical protein WBD37_00465 [Anderseniella sp.]